MTPSPRPPIKDYMDAIVRWKEGGEVCLRGGGQLVEGGTAPAISMRPSTTDWSSAGDVFVSAQRSSTRGGDRGGCLADLIASDTAERTVAAAPGGACVGCPTVSEPNQADASSYS